MLLLAASLVVLALCAGMHARVHRLARRGLGAARCGACNHMLMQGQGTCPECGRTWSDRDPGAATAFPTAASRLIRLRRAALVQWWLLGAPAAALAAVGTLYAADLLPRQRPSNAVWEADYSLPWPEGQSAQQMRIHVVMEGCAGDQPIFGSAKKLDTVNAMTIEMMVPQPKETPHALHRMGLERRGDMWVARLGLGAPDAEPMNEIGLTGLKPTDLEWALQYELQYYKPSAPVDDRLRSLSQLVSALILQRSPDHAMLAIGNMGTSFVSSELKWLQHSRAGQRALLAIAAPLMAVAASALWLRVLWLNWTQRVWGWARQGAGPGAHGPSPGRAGS